MRKVKIVWWTDEYHEIVMETEKFIYVRPKENSFFPFLVATQRGVDSGKYPQGTLGCACFEKDKDRDIIEE